MRKNSKRETIIEAAVRVFAQKGFYNAKVNDVAKEAGVADGTIYLYFKNKDDLLINLFEDKMEHILSRFETSLQNIDDPIEKLRTFIHTYFKLIKEDQQLSEVFQVELRQSAKFLKDYHNQKFLDYLNIIAEIIEEGKQRGFFRLTLNKDVIKLMVFGAIDEVARQWILGADEKYTLDEAAEQLSRTIVYGLLVS
ncbi:MAG TPA: TetR/AcrR family transcriptional regulator [Calditrichaeota bacterium]|nr:TetR/AcrR family transcriptional regulator [Calditrichota bacterium]